MMFIAALRLKRRFSNLPRAFTIPGGYLGYSLTCLLGLLGCTVTLVVGFFPPQEAIGLGGTGQFRLMFSAGMVIMILPALLLYLRKHFKPSR